MKNIVRSTLLLGIFIFVWSKSVMAACEVSVSPTEVLVNSTSTFTFSLSNTGSNPIQYITFSHNGGEAFSITAVNSTGWNLLSDTISTFTSGNINPGSWQLFDISGKSAPNPTALNWTIKASESDESQLFSCTTVNTYIVDAYTPTEAPIEPTAEPSIPTISEIAVAANATSANITWHLDTEASSVLSYGVTSDYGLSTSGTGESASLSGLLPSTTYHYQIQSTNTAGTATTSDNIFTTIAASANTTINTTTNTTTTVQKTSTQTKTVILADTVAPTVQINTQFEKPLTKAESIEGVVFDTGAVNAGISKIQYSLDLGKSWLLIDEPNGAAQSNFSFIPEISEDGNYSIKVRALDKSGNIGVSTSLIVIIDRLPPRIIHTLWNVGPVVLRPDSSGKIDLAVGVPAHFTAQGVGGITEMELSIGQNVFPLIKNNDTGFWEGTVLLTSGGEWDAMIRAVDGPGSFLEQKISTISVTQSKTVTPSNTLVTVWRKNELTGRFVVWNGEPYMQKNPYKGKTDWFLLPGTYYFYLSAPGYNSSVSTIFTFTESRAIAINTQLKKWNLWDFFGGVNEFQVKTPSLTSTYTDKAVGKKITWLENKQWKGKDIVFSIVPSWDPAAASRLITLLHVSNQEQDVPYIVVVPGANTSTVNLLKERGQYDLNFVADPDGEILKDFPSSSFPLTVKVNRRGIVEEVLY